MLVLGRKEGESILIEGGIRIVVIACDRGGVRIGIEAPPATKILRGEIAEQVASQNQRAAVTAASAQLLASLGAPSLGAPSLGAPSLGAPSLGAPPASTPESAS